jgi:hypothetical protein
MLTASIVISTYNRARSLERLLPSLDHLDGPAFEVVVVNGPSTDDTDAVLASYGARLKVERCPAANLSQSRNIGIRAASGDIVVFIDDDALPAAPTWLSRLMAPFEADVDGRIGAAGGASLHRDTEWAEFAGGWTSDYAEQRFTTAAIGPTGHDHHGRIERSVWYRRTVGNNSAFRRSALLAIGGFDEQLTYYLDEADVCLRLARAGFDVVYLEDAAVRHYPADSPIGPPFIRNRRVIARSDTYYCLKNGSGGWIRRLTQTFRRAPRKHFVTELPDLVADGRLSADQMYEVRREWIRGVVQGVVAALGPRRVPLSNELETSGFLEFRRADDVGPKLAIVLLSRRLPPDPHAGGVARYTYDLARGLHQRGHHVTIVTESQTAMTREALGFDIVGIRVREVEKGFSHTPVLGQNLAYAQAVLDYVRSREAGGQRTDVVHATNWGIESLGLLQAGDWPVTLMLVTPLESVVAAEGWDVTQDLAANIELDQWTIERADRVCAPSPGVLETYAARAGWTGRAVPAVPLGVVPAPATTRTPDRRRRLLFVGRHERRKGIHLLLDVLPELLDRHADWHCDLVGNNTVPSCPGTTFEQEFLGAHRGAPWLERVTFHGPVADADLPRFYANADLFVAPSLFESFGLIYLEAMQHGVPVVGARVGGVPDVVTHEVDGWLVPPGDAESLGRALDTLMSDDRLRARLGARAAESFRAGRHHLAMADRLLSQYREAMSVHASRGRTAAEVPSVARAAMATLEAASSTRGLGLAWRASAALEDGAHQDAAALIAQALTLTGHPDYYTMAVELALGEDDLPRAAEWARQGFEATRDDSDACLMFASVLLRHSVGGPIDVAGWSAWHASRRSFMPARLLATGVAAVRTGRDATAAMLLSAGLDSAGDDRKLRGQLRYHLGSTLKRRGSETEAHHHLERAWLEDYVDLPLALQAAVPFHLGELELGAGRTERAIALLQACLERNPDHARARTLLDEALASATAA